MATIDDLMAAIRARDATRTAELLADAPTLADTRPSNSASPILMATYMNASDCLTHLLAYATCDLFEASARGDLTAMEVALARDPSAIAGRSGDGWSALHLAGFFGRVDAARLLLDRGAEIDAVSTGPEANRPLHAALAGAGDPAFVQLLVESGADVRATGAAGITPMHIAASRGSDAFVDLFRSRGADPQAAMTDGRTPADLAAERKFPALADRLRAMR
jgi:ankyrin repeat protein